MSRLAGPAAVAAFLFVTIATDSFILGIIAGIAAGVISYKLINKAVDVTLDTARNIIDGGNRQLLADMSSTTIAIETSTEKETIIKAFYEKYPSSLSRWEFCDWICTYQSDDIGDDLVFAIGVISFEYLKTTAPYVVAKLNFKPKTGEKTIADFTFSGYTQYGDDFTAFVKEMTELIGVLKDTLTALDPNCKISEIKGKGGIS